MKSTSLKFLTFKQILKLHSKILDGAPLLDINHNNYYESVVLSYTTIIEGVINVSYKNYKKDKYTSIKNFLNASNSSTLEFQFFHDYSELLSLTSPHLTRELKRTPGHISILVYFSFIFVSQIFKCNKQYHPITKYLWWYQTSFFSHLF